MTYRQHRNQVEIQPLQVRRNIPLGNNIVAKLSDRWTIFGTTGSGKTTFTRPIVERLLREFPSARLYLLDTKQNPDDDLTPFGNVIRSIEPPDAARSIGYRQVWQPLRIDSKAFNRWFQNILHAGDPAIVWINELLHMQAGKRNDFPIAYEDLLRLGRGLRICVITESQQATYIPSTVLAMTTHIARFRMQNAFSAKRIDNIMGRKENLIGIEPEKPFGFLYRRLDKMMPVYEYDDWKDFIGVK